MTLYLEELNTGGAVGELDGTTSTVRRQPLEPALAGGLVGRIEIGAKVRQDPGEEVRHSGRVVREEPHGNVGIG